jgi:hypothetical protein
MSAAIPRDHPFRRPDAARSLADVALDIQRYGCDVTTQTDDD